MKKTSLWMFSAIFATICAFTPACASKPDDAKVTSEIQSKFAQDSGLSTKQLNVQANAGVVSLSGNVDNDAQREAAGRQAASAAGVKTVINNLQVGAAPMSAAASAPPSEARPAPASTSAMDEAKPVAGKKSKPQPAKAFKAKAPAADSNMDSMSDNNQPAPSPASSDNMSTASSNPSDNQPAIQTPPPPPAPRKLIIDQGTQVTVRLIDPIDSEKNQTGDTFHATLNAALTSDGQEAVPAGTELTGHLVSVKSAGKFAGQSEVVLQLDKITSGGQTYDLQTDQYRKTGSSRGKNTAEKVGGGAILGGIIGAIAGGGKGAAIGSAAGAGVGGGVQAGTKAQQIKLPSETVLNFTLQAPITVTQAPSADANRPKLEDPK
jgi:BON domain